MPVETVFQPCACAPTIGLVDAAGAALEDLAVAVDEEVVAHVVPAVGVAVVARDGHARSPPSPPARSRSR